MVLSHLGVSKTETELRELCDCTIFGTSALELVLAARKLGFTGSAKHTLTLAELIELTENGYFPIVYVLSAVHAPAPDVHSFVIVSALHDRIDVLDPQQGPRVLAVDEFAENWSAMNNLAIVIA
jgi:ABC-type bacteriocin/lantibiotic exporter with double-glycine peptidase domain